MPSDLSNPIIKNSLKEAIFGNEMEIAKLIKENFGKLNEKSLNQKIEKILFLSTQYLITKEIIKAELSKIIPEENSVFTIIWEEAIKLLNNWNQLEPLYDQSDTILQNWKNKYSEKLAPEKELALKELAKNHNNNLAILIATHCQISGDELSSKMAAILDLTAKHVSSINNINQSEISLSPENQEILDKVNKELKIKLAKIISLQDEENFSATPAEIRKSLRNILKKIKELSEIFRTLKNSDLYSYNKLLDEFHTTHYQNLEKSRSSLVNKSNVAAGAGGLAAAGFAIASSGIDVSQVALAAAGTIALVIGAKKLYEVTNKAKESELSPEKEEKKDKTKKSKAQNQISKITEREKNNRKPQTIQH